MPKPLILKPIAHAARYLLSPKYQRGVELHNSSMKVPAAYSDRKTFANTSNNQMKPLISRFTYSALFLSAFCAHLASAVPITSGTSSEGYCNLNDVTTTAYGAANDCYGLVNGNISSDVSGANSFTTALAGWTSFAGGSWSVVGSTLAFDKDDYTWTLNSAWDEIIVVLKQSTMWGAWYFDPADDAGTWSTNWIYTQGNPNNPRYSDRPSGGLSHGFILGRGQAQVPEPASMALFGLGLLGLGLAKRRSAKFT